MKSVTDKFNKIKREGAYKIIGSIGKIDRDINT